MAFHLVVVLLAKVLQELVARQYLVVSLVELYPSSVLCHLFDLGLLYFLLRCELGHLESLQSCHTIELLQPLCCYLISSYGVLRVMN